MSNIQEYLRQIMQSVYGKDVRKAIHDAINQCYIDASAGITPVITTESVTGGTQVNITVGDNTTFFVVQDGEATDTQVETYISEWLEDHPEATTTVQDGSITVAKLASGVIDSTLSKQGKLAESKAVGEALADKADADDVTALDTRVTALESGSSGGLTADIKAALLACFANVAWANENGQTYYDALDAALNPPANLSSITCVYTQSGTVYDTASLDDLKTDLVVTAHWSDNTTSTVTTYTLSGTLTEGTSTITVSYGGKSTTFNVTVSVFSTAPVILATDTQWKSDYTQGAKTGLCITDYYTCNVDYDALKASAHYDSTNDYMTTVGDIYKIITHFPNSQSIAFSSNGKSVVFFDMSGEEKHSSASCLAYEDIQFASARQNSNYMYADDGHFKFSFTLGSADVDDSYAYWESTASGVMPIGVTAGDIIFAGSNTPYYGCHNISEAVVGT